MSGKLLEKYTGRTAPAGEADTVSDTDGTENLGAFGWLRGARDRAIMLELRRRSGDILAIGYSYIDRIAFNPSDGITVRCGNQTITIKGRNLNAEARPQIRLFLGLTQNRIPWIAEADQVALLQPAKNAVVVEAIEWE